MECRTRLKNSRAPPRPDGRQVASDFFTQPSLQHSVEVGDEAAVGGQQFQMEAVTEEEEWRVRRMVERKLRGSVSTV